MRSATGDRRRPAGAGSRPASSRRAACCRARPSSPQPYAASRVTIRRALESLHEEGLVDSRQGFGWFVAADPLRQTLAQLGTIEAQLAERGVVAERQILDFGFVTATAHVRKVLGRRAGARGAAAATSPTAVPFARVTVWCPADLGSVALARRRRRAPVLRAAAT